MPRKQILVAEDEALIASDISSSLVDLGYEVIGPVKSGVSAIRACERYRPDLALMDIGLPGKIDGVIAAAYIYDHLEIPVVYLTGHSEQEVIERAKLTHPYGFIIKPFKEGELRAAIEIALHKHSALHPVDRKSVNGH